jgi:CheY-like chemotaxis protein
MTKVLIIYDHRGMIDVLTRQLEKLGFAVISVNGGMEGVETAITEKPDLIIMDTMMSGMDAQEATRRIRSNQETKDILILSTTAIAEKSQPRECVEGVCNDYIVKPFTSNQLVSRIEKLFMIASGTISGAKEFAKGATTSGVLGWWERVVLRDLKRLENKALANKKSQLRECVEGVYNDYIVKPFTSNQLVSRIGKLFMITLGTISGAREFAKGATTAGVLGWWERVVLRNLKHLASNAVAKMKASRLVDPGIVKEPRPIGLTGADVVELPREGLEPSGAAPPPGGRPGQPPPRGPRGATEVIDLTEVVKLPPPGAPGIMAARPRF